MILLLTVLLRGVGLALVGLGLVAGLRRASAATRSAVCTIALGAMLALPLGLLLMPKRTVATERLPLRPLTETVLQTPSLDAKFTVPTVAPASESNVPERLDFVPLLCGAWILGAAILTARTVCGWGVAVGWARRARPFAEGEGVQIRVSEEVAQPCALWAGRRMMLLPADHEEWTDGRRRAVILHEEAHLRRGDWPALMIARFALALHWPNPLAWALVRTARRAAEEAADDAVLRTGLAPSDYASHLLDLARQPLRAGLALPMASRPDVHRRIRHVLNPQRTHGRIRLAPLALSGLLLGGVLVPALCLVISPDGRQPLVEPQTEIGGQAGTAANGFVARMTDGRPVEMVQIVRRVGSRLEAWKPDGTPIPDAERIETPLPQFNRSLLTVLLRFPGHVPDAWHEAESSSRNLKGDSQELLFALGGDLPGAKPGEQATYNFLGLMAHGITQGSLAYPLYDGPWTVEASFPAKRGPWGDSGRVRDVSIGAGTVTFARPAGAAPDPKYTTPIGTTDVRFTFPGGIGNRSVRLIAYLKGGGQAEPYTMCDAQGHQSDDPHRLAIFHEPPSAIERIEISTRPFQRAEFLGVRLKPGR